MTTSRSVGIRWWPVGVTLAVAILAMGFVHLIGDRSGQEKVLLTILVGLASIVALVLWWIGGSRLPWRIRWIALAGFVAAALTMGICVEIKGVTGNLLPLLGWRWSDGAMQSATPGGAGERTAKRGQEARSLSYPRFLGPNADGTLAGPDLHDDWGGRPPREIWRRPVGAAWSAFSVAEGLAVTQEQHGSEEQVVAYDLMTGRPIWRHRDRSRYETTIGGVGPRATPTIVDGRVYTLGATGILNALRLESGERIWSRDILVDASTANQEWGKAGSPWVSDGRVVVSAGSTEGRSMLAYDWDDGAILWAAGRDRSGYSSPRLVRLAGREQIVILNHSSVAAHDPRTGALLWDYPWPHANPNVAQPLPIDESSLLVSSGYGIGSKLLRVQAEEGERLRAELIWESPRLKAKFAHYVQHEGYVYGLDDGVLVCLDPTTGERMWKRGRYGHGQVLLVGDRLLVLTETGELVLVRPDPDAHQELASLQVLNGKTWNNPALAGPYLLVRNAREAAMYRLALRDD